jgi:hypothetical protein
MARITTHVIKPGMISRTRRERLGFALVAGFAADTAARTAEESRAAVSLTLVDGCHPVSERGEAAPHGVEIGLADPL